jgi:hypothetical protein
MSTFNEQLQLSEYIVLRFKENVEDEGICMASAGFICLASQISKEKNKRRSWVRLTLSKRKVNGSGELLIDLRIDDTG